VGKTAILQNIAAAMRNVPTVLFELELSDHSMFERMVCHYGNFVGFQVEDAYMKGVGATEEILESAFANLLISTVPQMDLETMEAHCRKAELKLGCSPRLILVDYIQLIPGKGGSRYERFSDIAEGLRRMAKSLNAAVVVTSQVKRNSEEDPTVGLNDAKESGSIENSASLVLGCWRQPDNFEKMVIKVLKNSRGNSGRKIECNWNPTFRITEIAQRL